MIKNIIFYTLPDYLFFKNGQNKKPLEGTISKDLTKDLRDQKHWLASMENHPFTLFADSLVFVRKSSTQFKYPRLVSLS